MMHPDGIKHLISEKLYIAGTGICQTDVQNNIHGFWYNEGINKASTS